MPAPPAGGHDRAVARAGVYDGRFLTGVLSTGIYCLPSCPARPPRPENVVRFPTPQAARAAGLRACRRCHPDDFYRGYDPDEEVAARLGTEIVGGPAAFSDARAVATRAGMGTSKLHALFRDQFHTTPGAFLAQARVAFACARLREGARVLDAALDAGFESSSAFYANFTPRVGLTPDAYRRLPDAASFALTLPGDFRPGDWLGHVGRDPESQTERIEGRTAVKALVLSGAPVVLRVEVRGGAARCRVEGGRVTRVRAFAAHAAAVAMLNLEADPAPFEARCARTALAPLVRRRPGLRVPRTATPFEALVWTIAGQQVNLPFAFALRRRVLARFGTPLGDLRAHPTPAQLATVEPAELRALQFSSCKADYLAGIARACAEGELDLAPRQEEPVPRILRRLLAQRGVGPWSASYVLMRGLGFADCVPAGDVALQAALQRVFALDERPDAVAAGRLLAPFAPHRSFASQHLWSSLGDPS